MPYPDHPTGGLLAIFGDKNEAGPSTTFERDSRKAKRFFEHAKVVADSHNYDYAIGCYIDGLRHDPGNISMHESLRDAAVKRHAAGGKAARLTEKLLGTARKGPIDRLLHSEMLWSKDPQNTSLMVDVMTRATEADVAEPQLGLTVLVHWIGRIVIDANQAVRSPSKAEYVKARDLLVRIHAFSDAVRACKLALQQDPQNAVLLKELKNLEAEQTMQEGGYTTGQDIREGGFRSKVKDFDKQKQLEHQDAITKRVPAVDEEIHRLRAIYEQDPQDLDRLVKLVGALVRKETDQTDDQAVTLLGHALEKSGQYRFKMRIGDIRIRQMNRRLRQIQVKIKASPQDTQARRQFQVLSQQKLKFEFDEYAQRVKNYPTDLGLRYEYGKRLFALQRYDEAIGAFQQAKVDPKHRVMSLDFLGRCYAARGWFEEAVDTLRQGIEAHPISEDRLALELRYQLMSSLKQLAVKDRSVEHAKEAQRVASQVLQTDIAYRDICQQMDQIRGLVDELTNSS